ISWRRCPPRRLRPVRQPHPFAQREIRPVKLSQGHPQLGAYPRRARPGMRVLIDTDPGIDDAIAILFALAHPELEVVGITTVAGNIGIGTTTRNALRILALAGKNVPVHAGAKGPLTREGVDETRI